MQRPKDSNSKDVLSTSLQAEKILCRATDPQVNITTGVWVYDMPFTANIVHFDTATGIPLPPDAPYGYPKTDLPNPLYPVAATPCDVILPPKAEATGEYYTFVGECITHPVRLISRETGNVLATLSATLQYAVFHCTGFQWVQLQSVQIEP